ncbi:NADPH-dependent 2,4-dienoyl-CoA reductase, partial [Burkholderia thailandensis]|nr:NADPH-dependent 2,4-dienoyl-CoA reductase [Burkholderia thailandensis]
MKKREEGKEGNTRGAKNRKNTKEIEEEMLDEGNCDKVTMARKLLAEAEFVRKESEGREDEINTCIGCNQACL